MSRNSNAAPRLLAAIVGSCAGAGWLTGSAEAQVVERIGFTQAGLEPNASVAAFGNASIGPDGRFVCFASRAYNFVPGDTNGAFDVFLLDRATGVIERQSLTSAGAQAWEGGFEGQATPDGSRVLLRSVAKLVLPDNLGYADLFLRDRTQGTLTRISGGWIGQPLDADVDSWSASADFGVIAYQSRASNIDPSDTNGNLDLYVHTYPPGGVTWVTAGNTGALITPDDAISVDVTADGAFIAFASRGPNLVPGDTNGSADIFVWTRATGAIERVSVGWNGGEVASDSSSGTISDDGRYVAFLSAGTSFVPQGDGNGVADVYVRDRLLGTTIRASISPQGQQSPSPALGPVVAPGGSFVAFETQGAFLPTEVEGDWKLYRLDLATSALTRLVLPIDGQPFAFRQSVIAVPSGPGPLLVASQVTNLVGWDPNGHLDLFLVDEAPATVETVCSGFHPSAPCPCGNHGGIGHGCTSSVGGGGPRLVALGEPRVGADTLTLDASILPTATSTMFLQGTVLQGGGAGTTFGDGLRCVGGVVIRLRQRGTANGLVSYGARVGDPPISATGLVPAVGATRHYQVWFRNSVPFCTSDTFGLTNAVEVVWGV